MPEIIFPLQLSRDTVCPSVTHKTNHEESTGNISKSSARSREQQWHSQRLIQIQNVPLRERTKWWGKAHERENYFKIFNFILKKLNKHEYKSIKCIIKYK